MHNAPERCRQNGTTFIRHPEILGDFASTTAVGPLGEKHFPGKTIHNHFRRNGIDCKLLRSTRNAACSVPRHAWVPCHQAMAFRITAKTRDKAACTNKPQHRRLTDADVPTQQQDRPEGEFHCRPITVENLAGLTGSGSLERLDWPRMDLLQRLAQQFSDEADRAAGYHHRAGQRS